MRPFRFRAQAALDLRISQEEKALKQLAQAKASAERARLRTDAAIGNVTEADRQLQTVQQNGAAAWLIGWHRSWMMKQRLEVDVRKREAAVSAAIVERAATSVRDTHRQRRTLERLRDRSRRAYDLEAGRHEAREMNMLAGLRYLSQTDQEKGSHCDDRPHDSDQRVGNHDNPGHQQERPARA